MNYYLIGIKGTGMSALANILVDLGHNVRGADYEKKFFTEATFRDSIIVEKFDECILDKNKFYIIGNAFKMFDITNKIIQEGYRYNFYPEFLEQFFECKKIGVSGSHGKTTTTSFASQLISKPICALIGDGSGFGSKNSEYFLFEACEYQNHFLKYSYEYLIILNIDYDHPDFFKNSNEYFYAFVKAALNANVIIVNFDDPNCKKIIHKNKITFGFNPEADITLRLKDKKLEICIDGQTYELPFNFFGKHMAYNLAASFIVAYLVDNNPNKTLKEINKLSLPARRFCEEKLVNDIILISDYAHHPTEIEAVLSSIRLKYPGYKVYVVYQGHTHSRTATFLEQYISILKTADKTYIMPTFSSVREHKDAECILLNACSKFELYDRETITGILKENKIVIAFLGAGDIDNEFIFLIKK